MVFSHKEIAHITGMTVAAAKKRYERAIKRAARQKNVSRFQFIQHRRIAGLFAGVFLLAGCTVIAATTEVDYGAWHLTPETSARQRLYLMNRGSPFRNRWTETPSVTLPPDMSFRMGPVIWKLSSHRLTDGIPWTMGLTMLNHWLLEVQKTLYINTALT